MKRHHNCLFRVDQILLGKFIFCSHYTLLNSECHSLFVNIISFTGKEKENLSYPTKEHKLSRRGCDLLEKRMMEEKLKKEMEISFGEEVLSPPSPPSRHEKWKMARTKAGRQMTYEK